MQRGEKFVIPQKMCTTAFSNRFHKNLNEAQKTHSIVWNMKEKKVEVIKTLIPDLHLVGFSFYCEHRGF